jgi:Mg2+-importing ATPase
VVAFALHFSEGAEIVRLAERAEPWWLLVALLLQSATYLAQGEIWRSAGRAAHFPVSVRAAYELSLAKLFVDQALPSAGISGAVVVARSLERRGMRRAAAMAAVVVNTASYYATYAGCLAGALVIALLHEQASALLVWASVAFVLFGIALAAAALALSGRGARTPTARIVRLRLLRSAVELLGAAEPKLTRRPRLLLEASAYQLAIVLLDAATVWTLIRALGGIAAPSGVFASFMISALFRTIGVLPGGLGSFEAMSVLTLKMVGVTLPVALSATLLFRALSFWLPMLPGLWFSRSAMTARSGGGARGDLAELRSLERDVRRL